MFGNRNWFVTDVKTGKTRPVNWRGYAYLASWAAVIATPATYFLTLHQLPELLVWLVASSLGWAIDWRGVRPATPNSPAKSPVNPHADGIEFVSEPKQLVPAGRRYDYMVKR